MRSFVARVLAVAVTTVPLASVAAHGQEPSGPPPGAGRRGGPGSQPLELLPDLGKIGAQVGISAGASWNPYRVGRGVQGGGYIDLPLRRAPGGKLSYEILLNLSEGESDPFTVTNPIAYVANLAAGASAADALAGPPRAPFPVKRSVTTYLRLLQVSPFGLRYTATRWDHVRLRPYAVVGFDFVVAITQERPVADESLAFTGTSPFDDPMVGGLVAQAPELTERGSPTGQGNIELGLHGGAGFEIRVARGLSWNVDYRFTVTDGHNGRLHTASSALGFHW